MRLSGTGWGWMDDRGRLGWTCFCHGLRCLNILCNTHSYPCNGMEISVPRHARGSTVSGVGKSCRGTPHLNLSFVYASLHLGPPHSKVFSCRSINQSINQSLRWCSTPDQAAQLAGPSSERHPCLFRLSTRPSPPINTVASPARSFSRAVPEPSHRPQTWRSPRLMLSQSRLSPRALPRTSSPPPPDFPSKSSSQSGTGPTEPQGLYPRA